MVYGGDVPDDAHWVQVNGEGRIHPYGMHRMVNRKAIDVVDRISTDDKTSRRWVLLRDGDYEVWGKQRYEQEYGYELQDDERVSEAERDAITLKQRAIRDGTSITLEEVSSYAEFDDPAVHRHALIAGYYAAKANPDVTDDDVAELRELVRDVTGHVDLDHIPTVLETFREVTEER